MLCKASPIRKWKYIFLSQSICLLLFYFLYWVYFFQFFFYPLFFFSLFSFIFLYFMFFLAFYSFFSHLICLFYFFSIFLYLVILILFLPFYVTYIPHFYSSIYFPFYFFLKGMTNTTIWKMNVYFNTAIISHIISTKEISSGSGLKLSITCNVHMIKLILFYKDTYWSCLWLNGYHWHSHISWQFLKIEEIIKYIYFYN